MPFPILYEGEHFGILNINMEKTEISKTPLFLLFTIDKTGSMVMFNNNKASKIDYVKQTFKNMLSYLSKQNIDIYIRVHSFNVEVDVDIDYTKITEQNIKDLCYKIDSLQAEGSTNIELALKTAKETLRSYSEKNPDHQIGHIFMTDGEPTIGEDSPDILMELVNPAFSNIFLGFGLDHNIELMQKLGSYKTSDYQFIDNIENTSLIYGETIHQFLYPAIKNVEIRITNGSIYNWKTNQWVSTIDENIFVSEAIKTYQMKTTRKEEMFVEIYGIESNDSEVKLLETVISIPDLLDYENNIIEKDLTKYIFRQKVQSALYKANLIPMENYNKIRSFKNEELRIIFLKMRKYMRENDLLNDPFMKVLCDDIIITYQTIGSRNKNYYSAARQTSQGRQRVYNVSVTYDSDKDEELVILKRNNSKCVNNAMLPQVITKEIIDFKIEENEVFIHNPYNEEENIDVDEDDIDNFLPSNNNISCYATPCALNTMSLMSQSYDF
jgi:hypothetical protein